MSVVERANDLASNRGVGQGPILRINPRHSGSLYPLKFSIFNLSLQLQPFYLPGRRAGEGVFLDLVAHQSLVLWKLMRPACDLVSKNLPGVRDLLSLQVLEVG